jgi:hypothetical protein
VTTPQSPQNPLEEPFVVICTSEDFCDPAIDLSEPPAPAEEPASDDAPDVQVEDDDADAEPADDVEPPTVAEGGEPLYGNAMLARYRKTRDVRELRFKTGMEPTKFILKHLPAAALPTIKRFAGNEEELAQMCFTYACHEIHSSGEKAMKPNPKRMAKAAMGILAADPVEWIGRVKDRFGTAVVTEVGLVIERRTRLAKGAWGPFSWPATLAPMKSKTG